MMHPLRKKRLLLIAILLAVASVAAALFLYLLSDGINYFFPPSDIAAGKAPLHKRIRVGGMVEANSLKREPDGLKVSFVLTDFKARLTVDYQGILPDLFAEQQGAVAAGVLQKNGRFLADEILAKHDENYMPPEVKATLHQQGSAMQIQQRMTSDIASP